MSAEDIIARVGDGVASFAAQEWDRCAGTDNPFLSHAFLSALEESGSAVAQTAAVPPTWTAVNAFGRTRTICVPGVVSSQTATVLAPQGVGLPAPGVPKRLFGTARVFQEGGSLPVMGTTAELAVLHADARYAQNAMHAALRELQRAGMVRFIGMSGAGERLGAQIASAGQAAVVVTLPDAICWLFNIRGADVPRNPVVHATAILHADGRAEMFVAPGKLNREVHAHLAAGNEGVRRKN